MTPRILFLTIYILKTECSTQKLKTAAKTETEEAEACEATPDNCLGIVPFLATSRQCSQHCRGEQHCQAVHYNKGEDVSQAVNCIKVWMCIPVEMLNTPHSLSEWGFQVPNRHQAPAHIWDLPR